MPPGNEAGGIEMGQLPTECQRYKTHHYSTTAKLPEWLSKSPLSLQAFSAACTPDYGASSQSLYKGGAKHTECLQKKVHFLPRVAGKQGSCLFANVKVSTPNISGQVRLTI